MKSTKGILFKISALAVALILLTAFSVAFAEGGAKLDFVYPEGVASEELTISVYKDYPIEHGVYYVEKLNPVPALEDGTYSITEPGTYTYWARGNGYYNVCKIFCVTAEDIAAGTKKLDVLTSKMTYKGFEPSAEHLANAPEGFYDEGNDIIYMWSDEITEKFSNEDLRDCPTTYPTPFFTNERGEHEFTSQDEMMAYIKAKDEASTKMYVYNIGNSPAYNYEIPLAVFTTTDLSSAKTLEEAGTLVLANGKINIWIQSQIHSNEPASGEGALAIINDLTGAYGDEVLANANIIVIPRINVDGAYLFTRTNYDMVDMNRDHMRAKAPEIAYLHKAFRCFMPEVVIDGHEFNYSSVVNGYMHSADDIQISPATSLNISNEVNVLATDLVDKVQNNLLETGLRVYHYGVTSNNAIGRAYYGLYNSISILVETRGISAGSQNFVRRIYSQQSAAHEIINTSIARSDEIRKAVSDARADVVAKGGVYGDEDTVVLHQGTSGELRSPTALKRTRYALDGVSPVKESKATLWLHDTVIRERTRPTAYVISKDAENISEILHVFDANGFDYYELPAGSTAYVQQYYYGGDYIYKEKPKGDLAELRPNGPVNFPAGAYVIPMDQVESNIIAMFMEPDVADTLGYEATILQSELITHDTATMNYPIYRYIGSRPRDILSTDISEFAVKAEETTHTVVYGDTLWKIAKARLGAANRWREIFNANRNIIRNPDLIYVGQILTIPVK